MKTIYNRALLLNEIENGLRLAAHIFIKTGRLMNMNIIANEYRELEG